MIEKVNPSHPDKIADRIAGAIVDLAYTKVANPKIAVEVLLGHGTCHIIIESSINLTLSEITPIVMRLAGPVTINCQVVPQDEHLAANQRQTLRCGDNGIFKGLPLTAEERDLSRIAREIYAAHPSDGKYVLHGNQLIICQSNVAGAALQKHYQAQGYQTTVNPLGDWTGGTDVDCGATNRKLGSDLGHSVTGGGLHGKDLSKADVSLSIYAFLKAQELGRPVELCCAIGDTHVDGQPYADLVAVAQQYIQQLGGFEQLAMWGLF